MLNMECHVANLLWLFLQVLTCTGVQQVVDKFLCPGEQQIQISCSENYTFLKWNVTIINQTLPETRSVPYEGQNPNITPIMINSTTFIFSRDSSPRALPLVSTMTIKNVTSNLEGTVVSCTGLNSSLIASVILIKAIHIFDVNIGIPNSPEIAIIIHSGNDNFTVTLEWPQFSGEIYTVVTTPEAVHKSFTGTNTSVELMMFYNTQYDVSVTATLCGHRNATNFTMMQYATEDKKFNPQSTVTVSINPVTPSNETQAQNQNAITSIIASLVIVFVLSSTLFFIIGCASGWFGHKHKTKGSDKNTNSQAAPVYEDLQPSTSMPQDQEKAFELKENVAYGPI